MGVIIEGGLAPNPGAYPGRWYPLPLTRFDLLLTKSGAQRGEEKRGVIIEGGLAPNPGAYPGGE